MGIDQTKGRQNNKELFSDSMDDSKVIVKDDVVLLIKNKGKVLTLTVSEVEYVEVISRSVLFHMADSSVTETIATLSEVEAVLMHWPDFIKVHRSFIVNMRYIQELEPGEIITRSGSSVPISKYLYSQVKKSYLCYHMDPEVKTENEIKNSEQLSGKSIYSVLLVDHIKKDRVHWCNVLLEHNCIVQMAEGGEEALEYARGEGHYDCVVLEADLGTESGLLLCNDLAEQTGAPVIFLSNLDDDESQTLGFLSGGADYISKKVSPTLFWLKLKSRMKMPEEEYSSYKSRDLRIDFKKKSISLQNQELPLTEIEYEILCVLIRHPNEIYAPSELYEMIWGMPQPDRGHALQMHMSQLKRKLNTVCPEYSIIETVWGKGYRLVSFSDRRE